MKSSPQIIIIYYIVDRISISITIYAPLTTYPTPTPPNFSFPTTLLSPYSVPFFPPPFRSLFFFFVFSPFPLRSPSFPFFPHALCYFPFFLLFGATSKYFTNKLLSPNLLLVNNFFLFFFFFFSHALVIFLLFGAMSKNLTNKLLSHPNLLSVNKLWAFSHTKYLPANQLLTSILL